jgi:hypothetical protein
MMRKRRAGNGKERKKATEGRKERKLIWSGTQVGCPGPHWPRPPTTQRPRRPSNKKKNKNKKVKVSYAKKIMMVSFAFEMQRSGYVSLRHYPRDANMVAHNLASYACNSKEILVWDGDPLGFNKTPLGIP